MLPFMLDVNIAFIVRVSTIYSVDLKLHLKGNTIIELVVLRVSMLRVTTE